MRDTPPSCLPALCTGDLGARQNIRRGFFFFFLLDPYFFFFLLDASQGA
jgi:hypothetical protein